MSLPDLKQLEGLFALCRKKGVKTLKLEGIELTLSDTPPATQKRKRGAKASQKASDVQAPVVEDGPTREELLYWSIIDEPGTESEA